MKAAILIDTPARGRIRFLKLARKRAYYLAEPPILGIIVIRLPETRIEDLGSLVVDALLGEDDSIDGYEYPGFGGYRRGKLTIFKVVDAAEDTTLSAILDKWRRRYPMR